MHVVRNSDTNNIKARFVNNASPWFIDVIICLQSWTRKILMKILSISPKFIHEQYVIEEKPQFLNVQLFRLVYGCLAFKNKQLFSKCILNQFSLFLISTDSRFQPLLKLCSSEILLKLHFNDFHIFTAKRWNFSVSYYPMLPEGLASVPII